MSWENDDIANPMGFEYCALFDCARSAMRAYLDVLALEFFFVPENICPSIADMVTTSRTDQTTGLCDYAVHLYGYQGSNRKNVDSIALDPLMTGWLRSLKTDSAIISFGRKKMLSLGYGGAFLTNDRRLFEHVAPHKNWNDYYSDHLRAALQLFHDGIQERWEKIALWDRYLGDTLLRVTAEQIMPWRVMRRAHSLGERNNIVELLRGGGIDVGTNYPPLSGHNTWGDTVLNFFCSPDIEKIEIRQACAIIEGAVENG